MSSEKQQQQQQKKKKKKEEQMEKNNQKYNQNFHKYFGLICHFSIHSLKVC